MTYTAKTYIIDEIQGDLIMLYQCSGYSRLVCGGCMRGAVHKDVGFCNEYKEGRYCSVVKDQVHCEPVEEEGDE